ncbi:uncharacterized protein ISCGN_002076 [Ixodes scapularis]
MAGSVSLLLGAVFLLALAMQQTGAAKPRVFDLPKKIQEFVNQKSKEHNMPVNWWNMHGNHSHLIEFAAKYRKSLVVENFVVVASGSPSPVASVLGITGARAVGAP